jgi:hypothetical protein
MPLAFRPGVSGQHARSALRLGIPLAVTDGTELPVTTRNGDPLTLGTELAAGTTGSRAWYL